MALIQIPNLPPVVSLANSAQLECVQAGASYRTTVAEILANAVPYPFPGWYGSFYSTALQTNAGPTSANAFTFNTTPTSLGATIANNSQIVFGAPGIYNVSFSAQINKTDAGTSEMDIWFSKNGTNLTYSNRKMVVNGSNVKQVAAWNTIVQIDAANQYIELYWSSADPNIQIFTQGTQNNPTRPAVPSVALTVGLICDTSAQALQPNANAAILYYLDNLPTANPGVSGALWWNAGVLNKV
jgi:hypothetical protein